MKLKQIMLMKTFIKFFLFFDFSDYPQGSNFCDPVNRKVIGKIKDEFWGKTISEFIRLKSKMCSLIVVGSEEYKKAKRVKVLLQRYKIKNTLIFCLISI